MLRSAISDAQAGLSVQHGDIGGRHDGLYDVLADLLPHLSTYDGREAVIKAGTDAGVGNFVGTGAVRRCPIQSTRTPASY
jgi:hypothetical protein